MYHLNQIPSEAQIRKYLRRIELYGRVLGIPENGFEAGDRLSALCREPWRTICGFWDIRPDEDR